MEEIAEKLQMGIVQAGKFLRITLEINYLEAIGKLVWKPDLVSHIRKYNSILKIAQNKSYNISTLRHRFKVI